VPDAPELRFAVVEQPTVIGRILAWGARVAVAAAFIFIGASKFNSDPRGEWFRIFERIGWGQWFRYFTGVVQVTGGLFLLTPWTLTVGAILLAGTMIGATIVDIFVVGGVGFALLPLILLGVVVAIWFTGTYGSTARG
jgi:uncharacterized membrane protein YphA (DoxX/SURF4 family)